VNRQPASTFQVVITKKPGASDAVVDRLARQEGPFRHEDVGSTIERPDDMSMAGNTPESSDVARIVAGTTENGDTSEDSQLEFDIEEIRGYMVEEGCWMYKVHWCGYTSKNDSSEPADYLRTRVPGLIIDFWESRKKEQWRQSRKAATGDDAEWY
jgi:hypothetical protein